MLVATVRSVNLGLITASTTLQNNESWMELDAHADTTGITKEVYKRFEQGNRIKAVARQFI